VQSWSTALPLALVRTARRMLMETDEARLLMQAVSPACGLRRPDLLHAPGHAYARTADGTAVQPKRACRTRTLDPIPMLVPPTAPPSHMLEVLHLRNVPSALPAAGP